MSLSFTFNQHVFSYIYIWLEQRLPWKWRQPWGFLVSLLFCCLLVFAGCWRDWACKIRRSINSRSRDCTVMHHWESSTQLSWERYWTKWIYCLCDTPSQWLGHNNKEWRASDTFIGCRCHSWFSLNKFNELRSYQEKKAINLSSEYVLSVIMPNRHWSHNSLVYSAEGDLLYCLLQSLTIIGIFTSDSLL